MKYKTLVYSMVLAAAVGAAGTTQAADAVNELESHDPWVTSNDPIANAHELTIFGNSLTVQGVIGNLSGDAVTDADYYRFWAKKDDVIRLDIDGGIGGARSVDTVIALFGLGPVYPVLQQEDQMLTVDEGSISKSDARIEGRLIDADGYYTVAVAAYPMYFLKGGSWVRHSRAPDWSRLTNGDYQLVISGVTPSLMQINIDIKPGNDDVSVINPKSKGKIPVALLSSDQFAALGIKVDSLTFGKTGTEKSLSHCGRDGEDVNGDGLLDLVCHFENQLADFGPDSMSAVLRGSTEQGKPFEGRGYLKVLPVLR